MEKSKVSEEAKRIAALLRIIRNKNNLSKVTRKAAKLDEMDDAAELSHVLDASRERITRQYDPGSKEYKVEMGKLALAVDFQDGKRMDELIERHTKLVGEEGVTYTRRTQNGVVKCIQGVVRDGARYIDDRYYEGINPAKNGSREEVEEPADFEELPALVFAEIMPVDKVSLLNTVGDLHANKKIPKLSAEGMWVMFEKDTPPAHISDSAVKNTLYTTSVSIGNKIAYSGWQAMEDKTLVQAITTLQQVSGRPDDFLQTGRNSKRVSEFTQRVWEAHADDFEDEAAARSFVESNLAMAIEYLYTQPAQGTAVVGRKWYQ